MILNCPKCKGNSINQHRSPNGPIWCEDCGLRSNQKELYNPFIESKDSFGDRMKMYEKSVDLVDSNLPVFVRLDGKAFHTWTKQTFNTGAKFEKPFDNNLSNVFAQATIETCKEVGQVIMAYSQSDEVTFLLNGWQTIESQVYFGGKTPKIASVISSIFTAYFNDYFGLDGLQKLAFFDARVWNVPEFEIENIFRWRQQDAKRNSIQGLAQSLYSHKELNGKSQKVQLQMCLDAGTDWNKLPNLQKWGFIVYKDYYTIDTGDNDTRRSYWMIDDEIPYFTEDKDYINDRIKGE